MKTTDTHVYFVSSYLSNWHMCSIEYRLNEFSKPFTFNCSEQIYMALKAMYFNDYLAVEAILQANNPRTQKEIGREVRGFNQAEWHEVAKDAMTSACLQKFIQNELLAEKLLATGDRKIVEAAWYDNVWGVGLRETDPLILDEANWTGTNWLGEVLMNVRMMIQ